MRPGVRLAPLSLGRLALLARGLVSLARRSTGIFGRLWRQIEFGAQFGVVGAQRFDFLVKRSIASACERMRRITVSLSSESSVSRSIHSSHGEFRVKGVTFSGA